MLENVGFETVQVEDRTEQFIRILNKELKTITDIKQDILEVKWMLNVFVGIKSDESAHTLNKRPYNHCGPC